MVFGEIIEPSTRALVLDDELEELPQYKAPEYEWEGNPDPPDEIKCLVFIENKNITQICSSMFSGKKPTAKLKDEGFTIYSFDEIYLGVYSGGNKKLVVGEIVEILSQWIMKAKAVHCITSCLTTSYQPLETSLATFSRCLTNMKLVPFNFCKKLETPNLINGFGANILNYCINNNIIANLWVIYTDNMPPDSINSSEVIRLLKLLGFDYKSNFKADSMSSNLYM